MHEATPASACGGSARSRAARTGPRPRVRPGPSTSTSRSASRSCSTAPLPLPDDDTGRGGGRPVRRCSTPPPAGAPAGGTHPSGRIVIVAGARTATRWPRAELARFAARRGIPLLADPLSGARHGPAAIAHYDLLLRDPSSPAPTGRSSSIRDRRPADLQAAAGVAGAASTTRPDRVRSRRRLAGPRRRGRDARSGRRTGRCSRLTRRSIVAEPATGSRRWRAADDAVADAIAADARRRAVRAAGRPLAGASGCRAEATLFVASSMPIRDVEEFFAARERAPARRSPTAAPTGSTAPSPPRSARAAVGDGPVVLLIGDVALAHDIGGLLAASRLRPPADDRAAEQRRRRDLPLPAGRRRDATRSRSTSPPRTASTSPTPPRSTAATTSRPDTLAELRDAVERVGRRHRHHDHRGPHRPRAEPRAPPPGRGGGAGSAPARLIIPGAASPESTGSIAPSLTSVSASSAAGSESRTIPPPAYRWATRPRSSAQRSATQNSPSPAASVHPTVPAYQPRSSPSSAGISRRRDVARLAADRRRRMQHAGELDRARSATPAARGSGVPRC